MAHLVLIVHGASHVQFLSSCGRSGSEPLFDRDPAAVIAGLVEKFGPGSHEVLPQHPPLSAAAAKAFIVLCGPILAESLEQQGSDDALEALSVLQDLRASWEANRNR